MNLITLRMIPVALVSAWIIYRIFKSDSDDDSEPLAPFVPVEPTLFEEERQKVRAAFFKDDNADDDARVDSKLHIRLRGSLKSPILVRIWDDLDFSSGDDSRGGLSRARLVEALLRRRVSEFQMYEAYAKILKMKPVKSKDVQAVIDKLLMVDPVVH